MGSTVCLISAGSIGWVWKACTVGVCKGRLSNVLQNTQLNNHVCVDVDSFFTRRVASPYAGNCVKLYKTHTASVRDSHFFLNRVINVSNSLPGTVVSSATVTGFKQKLLIGLMLSLYVGCAIWGIYQSRSSALVSRSTHFSSYCVCILHNLSNNNCFSLIVCLYLL